MWAHVALGLGRLLGCPHPACTSDPAGAGIGAAFYGPVVVLMEIMHVSVQRAAWHIVSTQ